MEYREIAPPPDLQWFVRCYWTLTAAPGTRPPEPALPDGCPELILNLADPFEANGVLQPRVMLVGQITRPLAVAPTGHVDLLAVRLRPFGASLFCRNVSALTDRWIDVDGLEPAIAGGMRDVGSAVHAEGRLAHLERVLGALGGAGRRPDPRVVAAVNRIEATDGAVGITDLAADLATTPRHLQRLFGVAVGISPKLLCRIRRFQRVFAAWRDDPGNWAAVAVRCGYFDQAHLARDFTELGGTAPAGLIAALPAFTRLFTALNAPASR